MFSSTPICDVIESYDSGDWGREPTGSGDVPVVRVADIKSDFSIDYTTAPLRQLSSNAAHSKTLRVGDILVVKASGSATKIISGKSALVGEIENGRYGFANFLLRLKPNHQKYDPKLLTYFLNSPPIRDRIPEVVSSTTYPNLQIKEFLNLPIPDIPRSEQHRIVDILSRAEGIVRLQKQAAEKAREIIPALFIDMFGDPGTNPKGWETAQLKDVVTLQSGGTPSKKRPEFWGGTLPWVSPKDMKVTRIQGSEDHVTDRVLTDTNLKLVPTGSILIVVRGMILAHTVPLAQTAAPITINQDIKALIPSTEVVGTYLLWALKTMHLRLLSAATTSAHGTRKLDTPRLQEIVLSIPPTETQEQFALRVERIDSILASKLNASSLSEHAFQSLLHRAFTGQL